MKTITEVLLWGKAVLKDCLRGEHDTPELDAELLLSEALQTSREYLFAHPERELSEDEERKFEELLTQRAKRIPIAHILRKKTFYGLEFFANESVLTPRPETEVLVEEVLSFLAGQKSSVIVDIGTGSGCIAISLKKNLPEEHEVFGIDISEAALEIARKNEKALGIDAITWKKSDLLQDFSLPDDNVRPLVLVANLPYVPENEKALLSTEVLEYDPHLALFSGKEGIDLYTRFFREIAHGVPQVNGQKRAFDVCFFEFHPPQKDHFQELLTTLFPGWMLSLFPDLSGKMRFGRLQSPFSPLLSIEKKPIL